MNTKRFLTLFTMALLGWTTWAGAQSSGTVDYEVTRRVDGNRIRIVTAGGGGGNWTSDGGGQPSTMVVNLNQRLLFTPGLGKLTQAEPNMPAPPPGAQMHIMRPFVETTLIDFNNRNYLKYLRSGKPEADTMAYFTEEAFQNATDWEVSKKTKDILGYSCHRATCLYQDAKYTVWFTDAFGLTFSPVNGIVPPDGGFVLAIEGDDMAYQAKAVQLGQVPVEELIPPAPAKRLTKEEMDAQRQKFIESMGMPGGMMIRREE